MLLLLLSLLLLDLCLPGLRLLSCSGLPWSSLLLLGCLLLLSCIAQGLPALRPHVFCG